MISTTGVRAELAAVDPPGGVAGRAELSGLLRFSGVLRRHGGTDQPWTWLSTLQSTAARRADRLLVSQFGERFQLRARRVTAPRPMLLVELDLPERLLRPLGLDAPSGGEVPGLPGWLDTDEVRWSYVRGVALAGLRLSQRGRPHCEIEAPNERLAAELAELLHALGVRATASAHSRDRWRVVSKSRTAIGTLLAGTGASAAYLRWEEERARRSVRAAASRGVNADRANAERSVRATTTQVSLAADAIARSGTDELGDELRTTALARLANPTASLGELAELLGVSRATVSRRFRRLAAEVETGAKPAASAE